VALLLVAALVAGGLAWSSGQQVRQEQLTTRHHLYASDMNLIEAWQEEKRDPQRIEEMLARQWVEPGPEDLRGFEWYHLWRQYHGPGRIMSTSSLVNSVAFAPVGKTVAADVAGTVAVWDAATGELRFTIADNANALLGSGYYRSNFMSFAPDGTLITLAEDWETLKWLDPVTGQEQRALRHERELGNLLLSPDGMTLATSPSTYYLDYGLWDLATGEEKILEAEYGLGSGSSWEFAPDGQTLALGYEWGGVVLWDVATGQRQAELEGESTADLAFSPDGKTLAAATLTGTVTLWDLDTWQARLTLAGFKGSQPTRAGVQFSPDGSTVVVVVGDPDVDFPVQESWVRSWDAASGKERFTLGEQETGFAVSLLFAPDGQTFATSGKDNIVRLWDAATGKLRNTLGVHGKRITDLAFSSDSRVLASSSHDGTVRLWDLAVEPDYLDLPLPQQPSDDTSLAFSPDGEMLATGSRGGTIILWDLATFERRSTFRAHAEEVVGLVFDPAASRLASASADQSVKVWDVAGAEPLATFTGHPFAGYPGKVGAFFFHGENLVLALRERWMGPPPAVAIWDLTTAEETAHLEQGDPVTLSALAPGGPLVATIGLCEITLWKLATGKGRTLYRDDPCSGIDSQQAAFSPDGKTLAAGVGVRGGREDGERLTGVRLWDVSTGTERLTLPVPMIGFDEDTSLRSLAFSPNGEILATVSEPTTVRLWDVQAGKPLGILEESATVRFALFSPDGGTLATLSGAAPPEAGSSEIGLWEVETKRQKAKLQLTDRVDTIAFSPDGKMLATLPAGYGGTSVTLWDTDSGRWLATLSEPWSVIVSAASTEDGRILAATGETDPVHDAYVVKVRDMASGETVATLEEMRWLEFSPGGAQGVVRSLDGALALWDLASEQVVATLEGQGHSLSACGPSSAFSADGRLLATIAAETVTVWDVTAAEAQEQGTFAGGPPVALAPDGETLATWNGDDVIRLWNVRTGKKRATLSGFERTPSCVLFSPDGKTLVTAVGISTWAQAKARLWNAANGQQRVILQGYEGNGIVTFSPDGKTLATGAEDGTVDLWDPLTGRRLLTLHDQSGGRLAFSPDGRTLVATHPGEIRLWWAATEEDVRASGQLQGEAP
jgi:WD40 repeat protein